MCSRQAYVEMVVGATPPAFRGALRPLNLSATPYLCATRLLQTRRECRVLVCRRHYVRGEEVEEGQVSIS